MTNEELLVAMSNMMDQRLDEKLEPLKKDMSEVKDRVTNIELNIETDIRPGIITYVMHMERSLIDIAFLLRVMKK